MLNLSIEFSAPRRWPIWWTAWLLRMAAPARWAQRPDVRFTLDQAGQVTG